MLQRPEGMLLGAEGWGGMCHMMFKRRLGSASERCGHLLRHGFRPCAALCMLLVPSWAAALGLCTVFRKKSVFVE